MSIANEVFEELKKASRWMTTIELTELLNKKHSSVGRALRHLWARSSAVRVRIPDYAAGYISEWATVTNSVDANFPHAPQRPAKPRPKKAKVPKLRVVASNPNLNTTSQGDLTMQIEQAVETVLKEWIPAEKKFSAHDVTREIRSRVNAGTITIDPALAGTAGTTTGPVTNIKHDLVRDAVHHQMTGVVTYTQDFNQAGNFFEYVPTKPVADPNTGTPPTPSTNGSTYDGSSTL
jgi:hypothetical protein